VVDRGALERASCECYGIVRSTFDRLLGTDGEPMPSPLAEVIVSDGGHTTAKGGAPDAGAALGTA
jgi:hypothetical protein